MLELQPCPFCNTLPASAPGIVWCPKCSSTTRSPEQWNARPVEAALRSARDALVEALENTTEKLQHAADGFSLIGRLQTLPVPRIIDDNIVAYGYAITKARTALAQARGEKTGG